MALLYGLISVTYRGDPALYLGRTFSTRKFCSLKCVVLFSILCDCSCMMKPFHSVRRLARGSVVYPRVAKRTLVGAAQRRKATTAAGGGLIYPIVDHKYE
jgi:hypothetical protein